MLFHQPGFISAASPTVLMYEDMSNSPRDIHWLDCSTSPLVPLADAVTTCTQQSHIKDMCCVNDGNNRLLITVHSSGIYANSANTGLLQWSVTETLPGNENKIHPQAVAAGGHGHIFVSDSNNACIQMFSADGAYLGAALKSKWEHLRNICWYEGMSALISVHKVNKYCNFSIAYVSRDNVNPHLKRHIVQKTPGKASVVSAKVSTMQVYGKHVKVWLGIKLYTDPPNNVIMYPHTNIHIN